MSTHGELASGMSAHHIYPTGHVEFCLPIIYTPLVVLSWPPCRYQGTDRHVIKPCRYPGTHTHIRKSTTLQVPGYSYH